MPPGTPVGALGSLLSTLETSQEPLRSLLTLSKSVKERQRGNLERQERFLTRNGARKPEASRLVSPQTPLLGASALARNFNRAESVLSVT